MTTSAFVDLGVVVGYALVLLAIGAAYARGQSGAEGFYLADRTLGTGSVFGTTFATFLGTGLVFTLGSFGYRHGVGAFILVGAAAVGFLLFALAAPRLKRASDRSGAITLPAMMARHWHSRTVVLAAVATGALFAGTLAANLLVVGTVLEAVLGVPARVAVAGFGVLVVAYTTLGGFRSVLATDLLQTGTIVGAMLLLLPGLVLLGGGPDLRSLPAGHLDPLALPPQLLVVYLLVGAFAFFGSQDLFQRVFAARSPRAARRGMLMFAGSLSVVGAGAVALGIAARVLVPASGGERALVALLESVVPAGLVGVALLGLLGLANSDADSQLLTVASTLTHDLLPRLGYEVEPGGDARAERATVVGVGGVALLVAVAAPGLAALLGALGSWFAVLGVVVVATLFWERTTDAAAFAGLAVGYTLPVVFVGVTGEFAAAPVVGVVPAAGVLVAVSLLATVDAVPGLGTVLE